MSPLFWTDDNALFWTNPNSPFWQNTTPASLTLTYDSRGRLIQVAYPSHTVTYNYDAYGNRTSVVTT